MVDFNNDVTVTRPAIDIMRVLVLQRRNDTIEAFEYYHNKVKSGAPPPIHLIQCRMISLFLEIQPMLHRNFPLDKYKNIDDNVHATRPRFENLQKSFIEINEELDRLKLIRLDLGTVYDSTDEEEENRARGL